MFSDSFLLDIYGNPTTLGCQMANRAQPTIGVGQGAFPRDNSSATVPEMAEARLCEGMTQGKVLVSYGIMLSLMLQNPRNSTGTRSGRPGSIPGGPNV